MEKSRIGIKGAVKNIMDELNQTGELSYASTHEHILKAINDLKSADINFSLLSDEHLIYLLRLRLMNQGANLSIKSIEIIKRGSHKLNRCYTIHYMVKSDEWLDETMFILCKMFYPNEYKFLYSIINNLINEETLPN